MLKDYDTQKEFKVIDVMDIKLTVHNKLSKEKRDINIYHHSNRSAHIISYNSFLTRPLNIMDKEDFLHVSAVSGPGQLQNPCIMDLPSWMDYEYSSSGDFSIAHSGNRTFLKIPPGFPRWELKVKLPGNPAAKDINNTEFIQVTDSLDDSTNLL